jgi:glycosyltransferase involved in cell wall biosynthesis
MRILIALTYYRPHYSGLTIYTERVARALAERGHQVTVLTSRFDENLAPREDCNGVEVIRPKVWFHVSKGVIMPAMWVQAWKLSRQADVIHLHVPQLDAAPISLMGKLLGKPVVLTYHCDLRLPSGFVHFLANQVSNLANHVTALAADVIVQNSRDYAEHSAFLRPYLEKLHPIYPPVEVAPLTREDSLAFRHKYNLQEGERVIGVAARLATEKGIEYLAQALPIVLRAFPRARVLFVGPYQNVVGEEAYARRVAALIEPLQDRWSFLGVVSPLEMSAFFHASEVLVLPSINSTESFGIVQVEAMTCGTPVVATDLPGVRVPVLETGAGRIVPPCDAAALAKALIAVLERPDDYRGQMEKIVLLSTPEAVANEYEAIFASLLEGERSNTFEKGEARSKLTEYR